MTCPNCGTNRAPWNKGIRKGKRRWLCRECDRYFAYEKEVAVILHDKKEGVVDWKEWGHNLTERQRLIDKASWTQKASMVEIPPLWKVAVIKGLADMHFGSMGVDYASLEDFTENFLNIPWLFAGLFGDDTDNFATFKSAMAVLSQGMTPAQQDKFLRSWLEDIGHKILWSVWGNHAEFEEKSTGRNSVQDVLSEHTVHFSGIGVAEVKFGDQVYKFAVTHKTRNHSSINLTHGLKWMARRDIAHADAYIAGDRHDPSFEITNVQGKETILMLLGTLKKRDIYGERYFSYFAAQEDGALTINRDTHDIRAHRSLAHALEYAELMNKGEKVNA